MDSASASISTAFCIDMDMMIPRRLSCADVATRRSPSRLIAFLVIALCIAVPTTAFATPVERASVFPLHSTKVVVPDSTRQRHWKDGEYNNASLASRLIFSYVAPLLDIAAKRRLESDDAFNVPDNKSMERAVTRLEQIYEGCRERSQRDMQHARDQESKDSSSKSRWTLKSINPLGKRDQLKASETRVLGVALLKSQKDTLMFTGILRLLNTLVQAFPALLIARLLRQIESGNSIHPSQPLVSALVLVSVLSVKMVIENQYFHNVVKCACEVRGSLSGMIFDKSLRLSRGVGDGKAADTGDYDETSRGDKTKKKAKAKKRSAGYGSGGALNLMQSDAAIIEALTMQLHTLWDGLLQISIYIGLLYKYLGTPVIWGLSVLLATIPINAVILRILNRLNRRETEAKDARMKKTTESISNMQLLKLQSWESIFANDIEKFREEELKRLTKRGAVRALNQAISFAVPTITLVATLSAYAKTGKPIVASTIFTAISLFNQLRFPLLFYPMLIDSMANGKNSLRRISSYLAQEEIVPYIEHYPKLDGGRIEMINGNFAWATLSELGTDVHTARVPALTNANLSVAPGEIVAVVGEVGSGKSTLCKALIGELNPAPNVFVDKGIQLSDRVPKVIVHGSIAYCAQEAWLSKGTIRESIVFGREYDEKKYLRAIWAAGLDDDIISSDSSSKTRSGRAMLTHDTDVGEDGMGLSGGQRSRVALARALYDENAGVYILDDPLSALDSSVGSTVFERVSSRIKQQNAVAIFVTNDPNLPRRCDKVILMGSLATSPGSQIMDAGSYDDLISRGHDLSTIVHPEEEDSDSDEDIGDGPNAANNDSILHHQNAMQQDTESIALPSEQSHLSVSPSQKKLSTDDAMITGAIPLTTYAAYFKSVTSPLLIVAAVTSYFVSNGSQFFQQMVIARWTNLSKGAVASVSSEYLNKLIYAAVAVSVSMYFRSYLTMRVGVKASKSLHRKMLRSVFEAPLSFFSTTPSGQLLTRFGKELDVVDRSLPDVVASVMYCVLQILFSTLALTGVMTPLMAIPLVVVGMVYSKVTGRFRPAARDLKRCESKSRSPIYTHFREALRGADTIRSIPSAREFWSGKHRDLEDQNISVFYSVKALDRWLSVRLESLGNVVVFTAAVASIFLTRHGKLKSGSAGWGLTQALSITGLLTWAVRVLTDMETQFMSVERVVELIDLDSTAFTAVSDASEETTNSTGPLSFSSEAALLKSGWPWNGHVEFKNVSMRYTPFSRPVLQNISVDIPAGSTVGIVGRTGSGKSSLLLTLFRLVELEGAGSITIDGVDIRTLSPHGLRESLSIIPQSPTLFSGTLMYNLDASGRATADEAWSALEAASTELSRQFRESGSGLDTMISEGGDNLSLGQRQLICLARALIKRSTILVLDEATSSVDAKTDGQVQETIRREFVQKGVTVITVAHRLDTVLGYDKIIVLDAGKLVEMGAPDELLNLPGGYLRRLASLDRQYRQRGSKQKLL